MGRAAQQLKRVRAERAPVIAQEIAARPPRRVHEDDPFPTDTVNGEIVEVFRVDDGREIVTARVEIRPGRRLRVLRPPSSTPDVNDA